MLSEGQSVQPQIPKRGDGAACHNEMRIKELERKTVWNGFKLKKEKEKRKIFLTINRS